VVGDNIMATCTSSATYTGWKDFGARWRRRDRSRRAAVCPFFEVADDGGEGESYRPPPVWSARRAGGGPWRSRRGPRRGPRRPPPPALTVTSEKLGRPLPADHRQGSYDSVIVEFKDYVMMLEAGQSEARALAYIAETKKLFPTSRSATS
jgi:hypothetical protein